MLSASEGDEPGASQDLDATLSPFERLMYGDNGRIFTKPVDGRLLAFAESAATCRDTLAAGTRVIGVNY